MLEPAYPNLVRQSSKPTFKNEFLLFQIAVTSGVRLPRLEVERKRKVVNLTTWKPDPFFRLHFGR
jgi:hypothetical protein